MTITILGVGGSRDDLLTRARSGDPDPTRGPSHLHGDYSPGSYRRWVLGGGMDRAEADEQRRDRNGRRATLHDLWRRVHGAESCPPDVLNLRNYDTGPARIARECWEAWDALAAYLAEHVSEGTNR